MVWFIYHLPLKIVVAAIIVSAPVWAIILHPFKTTHGKAVCVINILLAAVAFAGIVYVTVIRKSGGQRILQLIPFYSFVEAKKEHDIYRSMLMNVLLFVPLGLTMPFAIGDSVKKYYPIFFVVIFALCLSVIIEIIQYVFSLGHIETDDVLCNTLGALIGSFSYLISEKLSKCLRTKGKTE